MTIRLLMQSPISPTWLTPLPDNLPIHALVPNPAGTARVRFIVDRNLVLNGTVTDPAEPDRYVVDLPTTGLLHGNHKVEAEALDAAGAILDKGQLPFSLRLPLLQRLPFGWHAMAALLVLAATGAVWWWGPRGLFWPQSTIGEGRVLTWLLTMLLMLLFILIIGHRVTGRALGLLIDDRSKMSLSRLQTLIWTIVILSGFLAAAMSNVERADSGAADALQIAMPGPLLAILGISTASLVGTPLILSVKAQNKDVNQGQLVANKAMLATQEGLPADQISSKGVILDKGGPKNARPVDLLKGDDVGNAPYLDLSKVQMFFFTIILVVVYGTALYQAFLSTGGPDNPFVNAQNRFFSFPDLDEAMVALLGLSHAGYLTYKAVPHTKTE